MRILDIGRSKTQVIIEGHIFEFEALPRGGLRCLREELPAGCSMAEDGHSPFFRQAKVAAGRELAMRPRRKKSRQTLNSYCEQMVLELSRKN